MRVLLVNPYTIGQDEREARLMHPYAPLGPLYVAAALEAEGHQVDFFDATFRNDIDTFDSALEASRPELVGVYITFLSRDNALAIGAKTKAFGAFTVAGGPDANVEPDVYLASSFDAVVLGEGEVTAGELVRTLSLGEEWRSVPGLAFMGEEGVMMSPARERIKDLNSIIHPARGKADMEEYASRWRERHGYFSLSVMSSRGCPYDCGFCSRPVFGKHHRKRSVADVVSELREIRDQFHPDRVRFADDILPIDRSWMLELCQAIIDADLGLEFECLARADLMDAEILNSMARAGFKEVFYGVESGSDEVLDLMCKGQDLTDIRNATLQTREAGLVQHWFIMFGYPGEGLEDVEGTVSLVMDIAPESLSTTVAYPIKGTRLYDQVHERLTSGKWTRSDDVALVFQSRYPPRFYRWTVWRIHMALWLRRHMGGRTSPFLLLFDAGAKVVSKVLAVEDPEWRSS
jgi:radical SAM superfamily enzyme YgiQ (UPF0313 family)